MRRILMFVTGIGVIALILYDGYVDLWNTVMIGTGTIGSFEGGYVIPQTILLAFLSAIVFGTVIAFGYRALSYLLD